MRVKLLKDIEKFHKEARRYLPHEALATALFLQPSKTSPGAAWDTLKSSESALPSPDRSPDPDSEEDDQDEDAPAEPAAPRQPSTSSATTDASPIASERITIALPSNLGRSFCSEHSLNELVDIERRLRVGQMNDALHAVRVGVAFKSFLYRSSVRKATSYRARLRSFDEVHLSNQDTLSHARLYMCCRAAYQNLFDDALVEEASEKAEMLEKYQVLEKTQLKANTALMERDVRGVSKENLPWFWLLDVSMDTKGRAWMAESESSHIRNIMCPLILARYSAPRPLAESSRTEDSLGGGSGNCG